MHFRIYIFICACLIIFGSCDDNSNNRIANPSLSQLERLDPSKTNVNFSNEIVVSIDNTMINNNNLHAGGGVAVGDINNDGLQDFVVISNQGAPGLFLNKGNFEFEDIAESAGLKKTEGWSTGVVMEDVNADGYIDIYIAKGIYQHKNPKLRVNRLYINNRDNTFSEMAKEYGIASTNATIQSVFFDYDLDGDLDLYLLNQPMDTDTLMVSQLGKRRMNTMEKRNSDNLYMNDGNKFIDVSKKMGITNWGNGLGIGISDINEDGYPDIYVTNDFSVDNFLYINKKGKAFVESNKAMFKHQSFFAMGVDIADINNDGMVDIFEVEMLPKERKRTIVNMGSMNPKRFAALGNAGFTPQYMRNTLHLNRARGLFSEIAQIGNVAKTDWSWGTLLIDVDDDGYKDIFVTNGIARDLKDRDFRQRGLELAAKTNNKLTLDQHLDLMVSTRVPNYAFQNQKNGTFLDVSKNWKFGDEGFSNGFVHGDFDNDGDLDLIVNNIDEKPWIYKNNSFEKGQNNINFKLKGGQKNTNGIGSKVTIYTDGEKQFVEQYVVRGFISSSQPLVHFGLGSRNQIDSLEIVWPDGKVQLINKSLEANKTYTLDYQNAINDLRLKPKYNRPFTGISAKINILHEHKEIIYDDYKKELLLPHKLSQLGPALTTGDVNNDGQDDVFVGGATSFPSSLYISTPNGTYQRDDSPVWEAHKRYEDIAAEIFDADNDGDLDLYVASGSNEFEINDEKYTDRLYLNDGNGKFVLSKNKIPQIRTSTGSVEAADIDGDNDMDLFVGGRLVPGRYPRTPESYILINNNGVFEDQTKKINESIKNIGMVTCAEWTDYDQDGDKDLFIAGEWMGINLFENRDGKLENVSNANGLADTEGWWFTIQEIDFDQDGDKDYVCGNIGLNHKFKTSKEKPFQVFNDDFDNNGTSDIVLAYHAEDKFYPVRGRDCSSEQMPFIKEKFPTFASFGEAQMEDIFGEKLDEAFSLRATIFASVILVNEGGKFSLKKLPYTAQLSAVRGVQEFDFNQDGHNDLIVTGNMFTTEVETSPADANYGSLLLGDGEGNYREEKLAASGFFTPGDSRGLEMIDISSQKLIFVANNNGKLQSYVTRFEVQ